MSAPLLRIPGPAATDLPPGVTLETILADLVDDQLSVPENVENSELDPSELVEQVQRAQDHGIDLSVVVVESNPYMDSQLRDLATAVGSEDGGTVLVLSPDWVGTFSDSLDRVTLERHRTARTQATRWCRRPTSSTRYSNRGSPGR